MGTGTYKPIKATYDSEVQDTVTVVIEYAHDSPVTDPTDIINVINAAEVASGVQVPRRMQRFGGTSLFAREFSVEQSETNRNRFMFTVNYKKPNDLGPGTAAVADLHPLFYPPTVTLQYLEKEYVIEKAWNETAITGGAARVADTLGPITNAAGVETQTPLLDVIRTPVIVIRRNLSSLAAVIAVNDTYQLTTNSDTVNVFGRSFAPRTLKFQGTDAGEVQQFEGTSYWETETRIEIHKTTDRKVNSVGTEYVNGSGEMVKILDTDGNPISEPIPIKTDGTEGTPGTNVELVYYYLEEVAYANFFI